MDDGRLPLAAVRAEGSSLIPRLERSLVWAILFGVLAFACAFVIVGFLGLAVYSELRYAYGPVHAAGLSAAAAAVLMALLLGAMRWVMHTPRASEPERRPDPLSGLLNSAQFSPKTLADLVTLVAVGIIAGLGPKR